MFRSFSPYPCHFSTHFQRLPSFLRRVYPDEENPYGLGKKWFLFPKGFKDKIKFQKDKYNKEF